MCIDTGPSKTPPTLLKTNWRAADTEKERVWISMRSMNSMNSMLPSQATIAPLPVFLRSPHRPNHSHNPLTSVPIYQLTPPNLAENQLEGRRHRKRESLDFNAFKTFKTFKTVKTFKGGFGGSLLPILLSTVLKAFVNGPLAWDIKAFRFPVGTAGR